MDKRLAEDDIRPNTPAAFMHLQAQSEVNRSADLYDFSRAGDIAGTQMKAIDRGNASFAAKLRGALGGWLRTDLAVTPRSTRQTAHVECSRESFERAYLFSVRVEPLGARALLELDMSLALGIVDLLLGGVGGTALPRELTEIEEEILQPVAHRITRELNAAWWTNGLRFEHEQHESAESAARLMASTGSVLCAGFEISVCDARGELKLFLPTAGLNSLLRQVVAGTERPHRLPPERASQGKRGKHLIGQEINLIAERPRSVQQTIAGQPTGQPTN